MKPREGTEEDDIDRFIRERDLPPSHPKYPFSPANREKRAQTYFDEADEPQGEDLNFEMPPWPTPTDFPHYEWLRRRKEAHGSKKHPPSETQQQQQASVNQREPPETEQQQTASNWQQEPYDPRMAQGTEGKFPWPLPEIPGRRRIPLEELPRITAGMRKVRLKVKKRILHDFNSEIEEVDAKHPLPESREEDGETVDPADDPSPIHIHRVRLRKLHGQTPAGQQQPQQQSSPDQQRRPQKFQKVRFRKVRKSADGQDKQPSDLPRVRLRKVDHQLGEAPYSVTKEHEYGTKQPSTLSQSQMEDLGLRRVIWVPPEEQPPPGFKKVLKVAAGEKPPPGFRKLEKVTPEEQQAALKRRRRLQQASARQKRALTGLGKLIRLPAGEEPPPGFSRVKKVLPGEDPPPGLRRLEKLTDAQQQALTDLRKTQQDLAKQQLARAGFRTLHRVPAGSEPPAGFHKIQKVAPGQEPPAGFRRLKIVSASEKQQAIADVQSSPAGRQATPGSGRLPPSFFRVKWVAPGEKPPPGFRKVRTIAADEEAPAGMSQLRLLPPDSNFLGKFERAQQRRYRRSQSPETDIEYIPDDHPYMKEIRRQIVNMHKEPKPSTDQPPDQLLEDSEPETSIDQPLEGSQSETSTDKPLDQLLEGGRLGTIQTADDFYARMRRLIAQQDDDPLPEKSDVSRLHPLHQAQYDHEANYHIVGSMTITPANRRKVWWKCENGVPGHRWLARVCDRYHGSVAGCPSCPESFSGLEAQGWEPSRIPPEIQDKWGPSKK